MSGTSISLNPSNLVIGTSSIPVSLALPHQPSIPDQMTTINSQVIQQLSNGISIGVKTLTPNAPAITIAGTPISLGNSMLVAGTAPVPLPSLQPMSTISPEGAGSSSASGIGGFIFIGIERRACGAHSGLSGLDSDTE